MSAHIAVEAWAAGCGLRDAAHETGAITVWQTDLFSCLAHCCCCCWAGRLARGSSSCLLLDKYWFSILSLPLRLPGEGCVCLATAQSSGYAALFPTLISLCLSLSSTLSACFGCSEGSICPLSDRRSLCLQAPHGAVHHFCIRKVPGTMNAVNKRLPEQLHRLLVPLSLPAPAPLSLPTAPSAAVALLHMTANYACQK